MPIPLANPEDYLAQKRYEEAMQALLAQQQGSFMPSHRPYQPTPTYDARGISRPAGQMTESEQYNLAAGKGLATGMFPGMAGITQLMGASDYGQQLEALRPDLAKVYYDNASAGSVASPFLDVAMGAPLDALMTGRSMGAAALKSGLGQKAAGQAIKRGMAPLYNAGVQTGALAGMQGIQSGLETYAPDWAAEHPITSMMLPMAAGIGGAVGADQLARNPALRQAALKSLMNEAGSVPNPANFLRAAGNGILDMPLAPTQGPFKGAADILGGNTLRQFFVHPRDRMPEKAGEAFGQMMTSSQRASGVIGTMATKLAGLNLEERQFFNPAVKQLASGGTIGDVPGITPEVANKLAGILNPVADALAQNKSIVTVGPRTRAMHDRAMTRAVLRTFSQDLNDPVWQLHLTNASKSGVDVTTPEGTKKFLSELITNPNSTETVRANALHLHNLGATTGREFTARTKGVYEGILSRRVLDNPEWVKLKGGTTDDYIDAASDTGLPPKPDVTGQKFVTVPGHPEFKHHLVRQDIAEGFHDLDATQGAARSLYNTYVLNPWKTTKVLWNVAAKPRDLFSNVMFNDIGGAHPLSPFNVKHYADSYKRMNMADPEYKEFLRLTGGSPGGLINSLDPNPLLQASQHGAGVPGFLLKLIYDPEMQVKIFGKSMKNPVGQYTEVMGNVSRWIDDWSKFSKYRWNVSKGMDSAKAADDAVKTVGDMSRQTPAVKLVRDTAMPFFGWQTHAIKSVGSGMLNHPVRTAKYFALPYLAGQYGVSQLGITNEEFEDIRQNLPKYMQGGLAASKAFIPLPYRDEQDRIQFMDVGWWIPGLQDVADLERNSGNPMNYVQNPVLTVAADLKHNKSFTGQPIWFEWDDAETKTLKALQYMYQQFTPAFVPGGSMWQKASLAGSEDPNRPTIPQAVGPLVGYRVKGVDPTQLKRRSAGQIEVYRKEATRQMEKEMRRTSDPVVLDSIREKYQEVFDRIDVMYEEGLQ